MLRIAVRQAAGERMVWTARVRHKDSNRQTALRVLTYEMTVYG